MEPYLSDYIILFHSTDITGSAVLTVVDIISQGKIFIVPKGNGIFRNSRIFYFIIFDI